MTENKVAGDTRRELRKYRLTLAGALIGLALAGWMFQTAYEQHVEILRIGDDTGERLQLRGMAVQEGTRHAKR